MIIASAFPAASVMGALEEGDAFGLIPIASTTSMENGSFTIPANYQAITAEMGTHPGSPVNVQILVLSPRGTTSYSMPIDLSAGTAKAVAKATDVTGAATATSTGAGLWLDLTLTLPPLGAGPAVSSGSSVDAVAASIPNNCGVVSDFGPRWVIVGQTSATTDGHTQSFTFSSGASSSLGIGASVSGAYGSFAASGTQSWSSTSTVGFPTYSTSGTRLMETQYSYAKIYCHAAGGGYSASIYYVVPMSYVAGSTVVSSTAPTATYCTSFTAGSTFTKSTTNAVSYSNGVKLGSVIGVDFSAKTGFTSTAKLYYTFPSTRHLCGTSDYPGGTPYQMVVKP